MACWLCEHAEEVNKLDWKEEAAEQKRLGLDYTQYSSGKRFWCRLNPVWIDVLGDHVCGQFRDSHWTNPYKVTEIRDLNGEYADETARMRKRAIDAERKLKAANAKIRELKAEAKRG